MVSLWAWPLAAPLSAQQLRPPTDQLLPETTVFYFQVFDVRQFMEQMSKTNFGQMFQDEKVAPLVEDLYQQAKDAFRENQDQIGVSWEDLEGFPTGEICFAVIAPKRADPQYAVFVDIDPSSNAPANIFSRIEEIAEERGATVEAEETEEVEYITYSRNDNVFTRFQIENTMVMTSDRKLAEQIVDRWKGRPVEKIRPLTENRKFVTIMNRCRGTKETPPEARFFLDPIELARALTRGQVGAQTAINFLPALGLDGLLGVGGSVIFDDKDFESISHLHVMLANPRAGILKMLALKPGDYKPENWVPANVASYVSTSWDVPQMYAELRKLVDFFSAEGTFDNQVQQNINSQLEVDFEKDVLPALSGRLTVVSWMETDSSAINAQVNGVALGIKDVEKALAFIEKIRQRVEGDNNTDEERISESKHRGVTIWSVNNRRERERLEIQRENGDLRVTVRPPEPSFAIIDDTFVFGDSLAFIKRCIDVAKGDGDRLLEDEEFEMIAKRMTRLLGTDMPSAVFYAQPGRNFEMMINLGNGEDVRNFLEEEAEDNPYVRRLKESLDKNPLPRYSDIKKYFVPAGGFVTSDDTGYHWLNFSLKQGR